MARFVREAREKYPDRREALELCLQAVDPHRPTPELALEPLILKRSFFARSGRGQFKMINRGPGYARVEVRAAHKKIQMTPTEVALEPNASQVFAVFAPARVVRRKKKMWTIKLKTALATGPNVADHPIELAPLPLWFRIRELVML